MKTIFLLCVIFNAIVCNAQHDFSVGSSVSAGRLFTNYALEGKGIQTRGIPGCLGTELFVQYTLFNRIGFVAGVAQHAQTIRIKDNNFTNRNPGFELKVLSKNQYWSYKAGLLYNQPLNCKSNMYVSISYAFKNTGNGTGFEKRNFIVSGEDILLQSTYKNNKTIIVETGIERKVSEKISLFTGIVIHKGLSILEEGTLSASNAGRLLSEENYSSAGSTIGIQTGLKFNVWHKDAGTAKHKDNIIEKQENIPTMGPKVVEGRQVKVTHTITVAKPSITISVWDDQKVDGDMISLNVNGGWIVRDYTLSKEKKSFAVILKPGDNTIVLHALNLGKIKPNTAALLIDDGITKQKLVLESDMESSGTLIIHYTNP